MPRIDLDGNVAGVVTAKDERYAQRMIAGLATRAAAKAIEDRKAANQAAAKRVAERPGQLNLLPVSKSEQSASAGPPRLGLAGLKAAAQVRRARLVTAK